MAENNDKIVQVEMPKLGVSVAEGTVVSWHKQPGDWVQADETICEISTDKVDSEIPAPASGRLTRILVEPDTTVSVGTPLAELDTEARAGEAHEAEGDHSAQPREEPTARSQGQSAQAREEPTARSQGQSAQAREESAPRSQGQSAQDPIPSIPQREAGPAGSDPSPATGNGADRSHFYSPVVQRMAAEHDVDLEQVHGSGVGGRIRKKDLLTYIESGGAEAAPAERPLHSESPYRPDEPEPAQPAEPARTRREPMSTMRKRIAEHMLHSRRTSAHVTTFIEVDMSRVVERRAELKPQLARRDVPLTYLAFVAQATTESLQQFPALNASIDGEELVYHDEVHLGIAVALEEGLIVPVVRNAERLNLEGLAAGIADVSSRARSKQLAPDDVQGGTFTITNPGQFGTTLATPIINQPQVGILDVEAIVKRPVVVEDGGQDAISIRPMVNLCLSFDHRALDGADAARFLADVRRRLEEWGR